MFVCKAYPSHSITLLLLLGKAWALFFSGHPISLFSSAPRVLSFRGPGAHRGLGTGPDARPPTTSYLLHAALHTAGSTWGNLRLPVARFPSPAPSPSSRQGCGTLARAPSTSLGGARPVLNKACRRKPSIPVWLDHQHLALTSDTKPVRQPQPPGVGWGRGQAGKRTEHPPGHLNTNTPTGHKAPASDAGITHPTTWAEPGLRQRW